MKKILVLIIFNLLLIVSKNNVAQAFAPNDLLLKANNKQTTKNGFVKLAYLCHGTYQGYDY